MEAPAAIQIKRAVDILLALLLVPIVVLMVVPLCLLVALEGGMPVYRHRRVGRGGRIFHCHKLRTMRPGADGQLRALLDGDALAREEWSEHFKLRHDPRVTPLGRFLRKSSLDELPQLWNVLTGEMSLVGPRPIVLDELEKYGKDAGAYLACTPGITGLWQVSGRSDASYEGRVSLDAYYAREWSLLLDLRILLKTIPVVLRGRGSC